MCDCKAVLFDLDGTLVDTAPDMVGALQQVQIAAGVEPVSFADGRAQVSNGALGLLHLAFPDQQFQINDPMFCEFINRYAERVCDDTRLFDGMESILVALEGADLPWGVVTNKPMHLTVPIIGELRLAHRVACVVGGDTLPTRKPDPAPMHFACEQINVAAADTLYVGDSSRDIEAARAAGMPVIAAAYGYIASDDDPHRWGADAVVDSTEELAQMVLKAVNLTA
ncbi:MAG: phosphoglycolate phosphatase [Pseudomonadota bacterium]